MKYLTICLLQFLLLCLFLQSCDSDKVPKTGITINVNRPEGGTYHGPCGFFLLDFEVIAEDQTHDIEMELHTVSVEDETIIDTLFINTNDEVFVYQDTINLCAYDDTVLRLEIEACVSNTCELKVVSETIFIF